MKTQINRDKYNKLVGNKPIKKEKIKHEGLSREKYTGAYLNWF